MSTAPDKAKILSALQFEWEAIKDLIKNLDANQWELPTDCPGWSVKDNISHIIGTELLLEGEPIPEIEIPNTEHLKNDIAKLNERWVESRRNKPEAEIVEEFIEVTSRRMQYLQGLEAEEWEAESMTPVGPAPYGRFMQIRVLDNWMHEQDIRHAIEQLGNDDGSTPPVQVTLDEISLALGFVVGKRGGAPDGSRVEFDVSGNPGRKFLVEIKDGRGNLVEKFSQPANIVFNTDIATFGRLVGGRQSSQTAQKAGKVSFECTDEFQDLAEKVLANLGYMI